MDSKPRPTKYSQLGYMFVYARLWRIVDITGPGWNAVGPHYASKAELLADLDRFAKEFGV